MQRTAPRATAIVSKARRRILNARPVRLKTPKAAQGRVLLYYVVSPFRGSSRGRVRSDHTHHWESLQMTRTFLALGYDVDVMSAWNRSWVPRRGYDALVASRWNIERLADHLGDSCVKVMHCETAHITFQNAAEAQRLLDLQRRRGVTLVARRHEEPCRDIEHSDHGVVLGNEFTQETFAFANKPLSRVHGTSVTTFPFPEDKDFAAASSNFLWMGSYGFVLKGLDLVLEAFAGMPEHHLYVCGPTETGREQDFVDAYHHELYECPNIHNLGWVDVTSDRFRTLADTCISQVNLSASEGGGGAVINGLHAGLIPIVSRETSVDIEPAYGIELTENSVEAVQENVRALADTAPAELRDMTRAAWEFARTFHTRERFRSEYREVIEGVFTEHGLPT